MDNPNTPNNPNIPDPAAPFGPPPSPAPTWPPSAPPPPPPASPPVPEPPPSWTPPPPPPPPPPPAGGPTPTFTSPVSPASGAVTPEPALSPLDNPWGSPVQPPSIEGSTQAGGQPSWMAAPTPQTEGAPTDLSHLINNGNNAQAAPETLVVPPQTQTADVPTVPTENHQGIPKWVIGLAIGLLLVVAGTSAYFILGIGQNQKTTSLPVTNSKTTQIKPPAPITTPVAQPSEAPASGSASFGNLQGGQQATSAADLLRQRQGR